MCITVKSILKNDISEEYLEIMKCTDPIIDMQIFEFIDSNAVSFNTKK